MSRMSPRNSCNPEWLRCVPLNWGNKSSVVCWTWRIRSLKASQLLNYPFVFDNIHLVDFVDRRPEKLTLRKILKSAEQRKQWEKEEELMHDVNQLYTNLDPQNDKSGYRLARRLCNNARPLFLKFMCDQIMGTAWWIKMQHGFDRVRSSFRMPSKYRLFCSPEEIGFI